MGVGKSLGVPVTENNGRFGKWSGALGQLINMVKWVMEGVQSAFGARGSAFCTLGGLRKTGLKCGIRRVAELRAWGCIGPRRATLQVRNFHEA